MLAWVAGIAAGFGLPVQTSLNNRLRQKLNDPFRTSAVSFSVSLLLLILLLSASGQQGYISVRALAAEPLWVWCGGLLGVTYLTGNTLLLPHLGAVQTAVIPVLGQLIMALLTDHFGWFLTAHRPVTVIRLTGVLLTFAGIIMIAIGRSRSAIHNKAQNLQDKTPQDNTGTSRPAGLIQAVLIRSGGVFIGMLLSIQTAVNGHVAEVTGSPLKSSVVSFAGGTIAILLICLIRRLTGKTGRPGAEKGTWWMWFGGFIGAAYVFITSRLAGLLGVSLTVMLVLSGSLTSSVLIDQFALFGVRKSPLNLLKLAGLAFMFSGVILVRFL